MKGHAAARFNLISVTELSDLNTVGHARVNGRAGDIICTHAEKEAELIEDDTHSMAANSTLPIYDLET